MDFFFFSLVVRYTNYHTLWCFKITSNGLSSPSFFQIREGFHTVEVEGFWPVRQDLSRPLASLSLALVSVNVVNSNSLFSMWAETSLEHL